MKDLKLSYECLNAIGNTFDLYSMISEVLITFLKSTKALGAGYYPTQKHFSIIKIGSLIPFKEAHTIEANEKYSILQHEETYIIQLHLQYGYLLFSYKHSLKETQHIAEIFAQFNTKITLAINACKGIKELISLNENLEEKVEEKIKKIREHEHMLLLRSKQAVMGEMIEMIAHQWRQPLTAAGMAINNLLFDITLDELNNETLSKELSTVNQQIEYLSHTIDDFRNFFRQENFKEHTSLHELIEKTISLVEKQLQEKEITLKLTNDCNFDIVIYKNELMQVLLNIIANAKDAFNDNSDKYQNIIEIQCFSQEDSIKIIISDNAGGIPEDILPQIFEPYFSTKKEKNGTGLGLYMSQIIIHEHLQGEISVHNIANGAAFEITIPILEENKNDQRADH